MSTFVSGRYICFVVPVPLHGRSWKRPPFSASSREAKIVDEPKCGYDMKSMAPSVPTSATVCRSPMTPWFPIGRYLPLLMVAPLSRSAVGSISMIAR